MKKWIGAVLICAAISGCTANQRARQFGGTITKELPAGQKLITATWKDGDSLFYLTRPMRADEQPETYTFKEDSSFGLIEGTVIIRESR